MSADDAVTELWVYAGKRLSKQETLVNCWIAPDDNGLYPDTKLLAYAKFGSRCIVGGLYGVSVERGRLDNPDAIQIWGDPEWKQRYPNKQLTQQLHNADNEARQNHARIRHHKNEAKVDAHDAAMVPLLEFAKNCRTQAERDALVATTIRKLSQGWLW